MLRLLSAYNILIIVFMKGLCELNRVKSNKIYTDVTVNSHNMQTTEENSYFCMIRKTSFLQACAADHI